jgi:predicted dehydrogenase
VSSSTSTLPRLGFLGLGWIGRQRMESIAAAHVAQVVAMADPDAALLLAATELVPGVVAVPSLEAMLQLELDGIVIASPSALHAEQTIAALEKGLAVFCQKPLGRNATEVRTIIAAARRADHLLGVDLSYRHVEGMRKTRELLQARALGDVFAADLVFHNAYGPQKPWFYDRKLSGGGCVIDLGIHLVDAAMWALDAKVVDVSGCVFAHGRRLSPGDETVEDYATARLQLDTGAVVNLACSWKLHAGRQAVIEAAFYGTGGGVALRNVGGSFLDFQTERFTGTAGELLASPPEDWGGRAAVAWARQLDASRAYDPEIERQIEVAQVLDAIYGRTASP